MSFKSSNRSNRMNVRHLVPSVSRRLLSMGSLMLAAGLQQPVHASGVDLSKFRRIEPQYIAALGDAGATSGNGAQSWGLWSQDPGPRGCKLDRYDQFVHVSAHVPYPMVLNSRSGHTGVLRRE